jgi:hypothetical protein
MVMLCIAESSTSFGHWLNSAETSRADAVPGACFLLQCRISATGAGFSTKKQQTLTENAFPRAV